MFLPSRQRPYRASQPQLDRWHHLYSRMRRSCTRLRVRNNGRPWRFSPRQQRAGRRWPPVQKRICSNARPDASVHVGQSTRDIRSGHGPSSRLLRRVVARQRGRLCGQTCRARSIRPSLHERRCGRWPAMLLFRRVSDALGLVLGRFADPGSSRIGDSGLLGHVDAVS